VLVLLAGCGSSGGGGGAVTLGYQVPPVGSAWIRTLHQASDATIPQAGPVHDELNVEERIEIIAVSPERVTKEQVTFTKVEKHQTVGGKDVTRPMSIDGATYVLELAGDDVTVTTAAGAPAADEERDLVLSLEKDFQLGGLLERFLAGKTFHEGEAADLPSDQVTALLADADEGVEKATMKLTFRGMDGALARFDVAAGLAGTKKEMHMDSTLIGKVELDPATGRVASERLGGPIHLSGRFDATGTTELGETLAAAP
jgi:hypothetical protein